MKRRIVLVALILGVMGLLAGGIWWYVHRSSSAGLLKRAELALEAGKPDKAIELANSYVQQTDDWKGYLLLGRACNEAGRPNQARQHLQEARNRKIDERIFLAMADTYVRSGRRYIEIPRQSLDVEAVGRALEQFQLAQKALLEYPGPVMPISMREHMGMSHLLIARTHRLMGEYFRKSADTATTGGSAEVAADLSQRARTAWAAANESYKKATGVLLEVVQGDPSQIAAANALVETALYRHDTQTLAEARAVLLKLPNPPPLAAVRLIINDLPLSEGTLSPAARQKVQQGLGRIREILGAQSNGNASVGGEVLTMKVYLGELHLQLGQVVEAQSLCDEALAADSRHAQALLLRGKLLIRQNKLVDAERELYELKATFAEWPDAHYFYGLAAQAQKKYNLADQAMRTAAQLDPTHAQARQCLVESMLRQGHAKDAFQDARELQQIRPRNPHALRLLTEVACRMERPEMAYEPIDQALKDCADSPAMLMAICDSYDRIGSALSEDRKGQADKIVQKVLAMKGGTPEDRYAIARALRVAGRLSEAEAILTQEVAGDPQSATARYGLGEFYGQLGRKLQSIEQYRKAVELDSSNPGFQYALARALFEAGDLDASKSQVDLLVGQDAKNPLALMLSAQLDLLVKESVNVQASLGGMPDRQVASFWLAYTSLLNNQPRKCLDVCLPELEERPDDADLRLLCGQAYLLLGMQNECIEQWKALLKLQDDRPAHYLRLANQFWESLKLQKGPGQVQVEQVRDLLTSCGGREELADLAMGQLYDRLRQFDAAAASYDRVVKRPGIPREHVGQAMLLRAWSLSSGGKTPEALVLFDQLSNDSFWRTRALYGKAQLYCAGGQADLAVPLLDQLSAQSRQAQDFDALNRLSQMYMQLGKSAAALVMCDELIRQLPGDSRPYMMKINLFIELGQLDQADPLYERACGLAGGDFAIYVSWVRSLDSRNQFAKAEQVLDRLAALGQAGQCASLLERGRLYGSYGLAKQAGEFYRQAEPVYARSAALRLEMAERYLQLGLEADVRRVLGDVGKNVSAGQMLIALEKSPQEQLKRVRALRKDADAPGLLAQEMQVLASLDKAQEALDCFTAFVQANGKGALPQAPAQVAMNLMLQKGDLASAQALAARMAGQDDAPQNWRTAALMLSMDRQPKGAMGYLPLPAKASWPEAVAALMLTRDDPEQSAKWRQRIVELGTGPQKKAQATVHILLTLAQLWPQGCEEPLAILRDAGATPYQSALELVNFAKANDAQGQAATLLKATLAMDLGLTDLSRQWAMEVLKARPACQWAAGIVLLSARSAAQVNVLEEAAKLVEPKECAMARMLWATVCTQRNQIEEALAHCRDAAKAGNDSPELVMQLAQATERAGKLDDAFALYQQVVGKTNDPVAANNAAYLGSQLWPRDKARLAQCRQWMEKALAAAPGMIALYDTSGWIAHLQGNDSLACSELQKAVRMMPASPEVHYHLGMAYKGVGNARLSQLHLAQAVELGKSFQAQGQATKSMTESVRLAQQAMAMTGPTRP